MVKPRIRASVEGAGRCGDEAVELAGEAGLELDEWQAAVLRESLKTRSDGKWAAAEVGVNVARQNGKGAILEARMLAELYIVGTELTIYSAHNFDTALEHFRRIAFLIEETPRLSRELIGTKGSRPYGITFGKGNEGVELEGNRRLRFRTRTAGGGRGFSCDLLLLDEAMFLPEFTFGALEPTLSARPNPQVWYTGSAVDQQIHEHGVVFTRVRERGIAGDDPELAYFEWSVEPELDENGRELGPETVSVTTAADPAAWAQANPAIGIRIGSEHVAREHRSLAPRTFAVERLGIGDWPRVDHEADNPIDLDAFLELEDQASEIADTICLAFDVSPDRRASIAASGRNGGGLWHLEIVDDRRGTSWLPARLKELSDRHYPDEIICDGYGPAGSLVDAIEDLGLIVRTLAAGEYAQACGRFVDRITAGELRHRGDPALIGAIRAAKTRPLGDAWAWSRKHSTANISPLVSATLALDSAALMRQTAGLTIA